MDEEVDDEDDEDDEGDEIENMVTSGWGVRWFNLVCIRAYMLVCRVPSGTHSICLNAYTLACDRLGRVTSAAPYPQTMGEDVRTDLPHKAIDSVYHCSAPPHLIRVKPAIDPTCISLNACYEMEKETSIRQLTSALGGIPEGNTVGLERPDF